MKKRAMGGFTRRCLSWFLVGGLALLANGCSQLPRPVPLPPAERATLGTVGVVSVAYAPLVRLYTPAKGGLAGAGRKAGKWAGQGFLGPLEGGAGSDPLAGLMVMVISVTAGTLGGVSGGVVGALEAPPAAQVEAQEATIRGVLGGQELQQELQERFVEQAVAAGADTVLALAEIGPTTPDGAGEYAGLPAQGVASVVEVGISQLGLDGEMDVDPPLALHLDYRLRLVETVSGHTRYTVQLTYVGAPRRFADWAADGGRPLLDELRLACDCAARNLVDLLLLAPPLPVEKRWWRPDPEWLPPCQPTPHP